jgi:endonuclease/exonuclease/phosphatase family metal-dependent hydrolase
MRRLCLLLIATLTLSATILADDFTTITMMSYNIKGYGITESRLGEVAKVINYYLPDMVAVQEVDNRTPAGFKYDNLSDLAAATNMKSTFLPLVGTYYGIGLLSKTTPLSIRTQTFAFTDATKDKEDRGIIIAEYPDFFFIATHYSLNANDRDTATKWITDFAASSDKTVFVAGDFNAQPTYRAMVTFKNNGFKILNDVNQYTFSSTSPEECIDMVLCYSNFDEAKKYDVVESGIAKTPGVILSSVSDHLPVYVELKPINTAIEKVDGAGKVSITPMSGGFSVNGVNGTARVQIYDMSGRLMKTTSVSNNEVINMSSVCSSGLYIIKITEKLVTRTIKYKYNY